MDRCALEDGRVAGGVDMIDLDPAVCKHSREQGHSPPAVISLE
jgi:hypothetical protein